MMNGAAHVVEDLLCADLDVELAGFNLDAWCALLSLTIKHRYDEHPFILNYSPVKDHLDNYCCEICCEEGYPKSWFYHCDDCDHASVL